MISLGSGTVSFSASEGKTVLTSGSGGRMYTGKAGQPSIIKAMGLLLKKRKKGEQSKLRPMEGVAEVNGGPSF